MRKRTWLKLVLASVSGTLGSMAMWVKAGTYPKTGTTKSRFPVGILYTRKYPGRWKGKVGGHIPRVRVNGNSVRVETFHGMSAKHYIVRHTIVDDQGNVLASKTFKPSDLEPVSEFKIPPAKGVLYATSFCNKHDMWVESFYVD